jgi:hypothetical protein
MWLITVKPSYVSGFRIVQSLVPILYNLLEDQKPLKGNTVGSRSSLEKAYIAGFLDGDGSLMLQLKKRSDGPKGYRFMATICLYQDSRHEMTLHWIREVLGAGYITRRNDHITELRVQGFSKVLEVLTDLIPFIRFKAVQAEALTRACMLLQSKKKLSQDDLLILVELMLVIQKENYASSRKKTKTEILTILGLTP